MKNIKKSFVLLSLLAASSVNALTLVLEDFDGYADTSSLQGDVFSFGSAAQAGKPSLAEGLGENDTNAACFNLTWSTGNNANLSLIRLSPNVRDLSGYSEIRASVLIENTSSGNSQTASSTRIKIAIEGGPDNSIWQTRTIKAERPTTNTFYILRFDLSTSSMERVEGASSLEDVLRDIENIRIRFEGTQQQGFQQDAYIDTIIAIQ